MDATPMVARAGQKIHLRYRMLGNVDEGRIIRPNNAGTIPLTDEGNGVFSVDVIAPAPGVRDVFNPILGEVRGYIGPDAKCFNNSFVQVITDEVPSARIVKLATDAQRADYVVNLAIPSASLPGFSALSFSFDPAPIARRFYQLFGDDYDMLNFILPGFYENRYHTVVKNTELGIALAVQDNTAGYGSKGRLLGVNTFPLFPYFDGAERGATHEISHQWLCIFRRSPSQCRPLAGFQHGHRCHGVRTWDWRAGLEFPDCEKKEWGCDRSEPIGSGRAPVCLVRTISRTRVPWDVWSPQAL